MMALRNPAPSWHDLVQPGPKGDPEKRLARAARRAELQGKAVAPPDPPKLQRHGVKSVRPWQRGRLVLHKPKPARPSGTAPAAPKRIHTPK